MDYLYHASNIGDIRKLKASSSLHKSGDRVLYLTDNIPYALLYIWDEGITGYGGKHVTGWIRGGIAFYEEQFPDQLEAFYTGASGYLYRIPKPQDLLALENREGLFYSSQEAKVDQVKHIPDVQEALLDFEKKGKFQVLRYNEQSEKRKSQLIDLMAEAIVRADFYEHDEARRLFVEKYFPDSWKKAKRII